MSEHGTGASEAPVAPLSNRSSICDESPGIFPPSHRDRHKAWAIMKIHGTERVAQMIAEHENQRADDGDDSALSGVSTCTSACSSASEVDVLIDRPLGVASPSPPPKAAVSAASVEGVGDSAGAAAGGSSPRDAAAATEPVRGERGGARAQNNSTTVGRGEEEPPLQPPGTITNDTTATPVQTVATRLVLDDDEDDGGGDADGDRAPCAEAGEGLTGETEARSASRSTTSTTAAALLTNGGEPAAAAGETASSEDDAVSDASDETVEQFSPSMFQGGEHALAHDVADATVDDGDVGRTAIATVATTDADGTTRTPLRPSDEVGTALLGARPAERGEPQLLALESRSEDRGDGDDDNGDDKPKPQDQSQASRRGVCLHNASTCRCRIATPLLLSTPCSARAGVPLPRSPAPASARALGGARACFPRAAVSFHMRARASVSR